MRASKSVLSIFQIVAVSTLLAAAGAGCSDGGETGTGGSTAGTGGTGGSTAGTGAGGSGGTGATAGTGGSGGVPTACLPESATSSLLAIAASDLCAVAVYTMEGSAEYQQPTWGAHGGPLLVQSGPGAGQITLLRWSAPAAAEGALTLEKATIDAQVPAGAFVGGEALDLGFRDGTAVSFTEAQDTKGQLLVAEPPAADESYAMNGLFSAAVLPAGDSGRLVFSGLAPLGSGAAGPNGLYAADDCEGSFATQGPACAGSMLVAEWGDASGPVVADSQGNVFAVMIDFSGEQSARAFAASTIAKDQPPADGSDLFTIGGFGLGLGALAPTADENGIVAFQPSDANTFEALDVVEVRYSVDGGAVTAQGGPETLLSFATPNTAAAMFTDPFERLWVGVPVKDGGGATTSTTFVVIARRP